MFNIVMADPIRHLFQPDTFQKIKRWLKATFFASRHHWIFRVAQDDGLAERSWILSVAALPPE